MTKREAALQLELELLKKIDDLEAKIALLKAGVTDKENQSGD